MEKFVLVCLMLSFLDPVFCNDKKRLMLRGFRDPFHAGGAMYTRWGKQSCPEDTDLVYTGQAGGSNFNHQGGAVNYLCLHLDPTWDNYDDKINNHAFVYGAEIDTTSQNIKDTVADKRNKGLDVPCAVCRSRIRSSSLMIPGRNKCDDEWNLEYKGYLVAGKYTQKAATEYVCMDRDPDGLHGGYEKKLEDVFMSVEARCGTLRCPPYVDGREITCAVCTK